jgi:hypothetical protein
VPEEICPTAIAEEVLRRLAVFQSPKNKFLICCKTFAVSSPVVELEAAPRKAVIVVNAVSVAPDPSVQIPDAQLSGNFVVEPSLGKASPIKSLAGDGRSAENTPAKNSASASQSYKGGGPEDSDRPGLLVFPPRHRIVGYP